MPSLAVSKKVPSPKKLMGEGLHRRGPPPELMEAVEFLFAIATPTYPSSPPSVEQFFSTARGSAIDPSLLSFLQHIHGCTTVQCSIPVPDAYNSFLLCAHTLLLALLVYPLHPCAESVSAAFGWCMKLYIPAAKDVSLALSRLPTWIDGIGLDVAADGSTDPWKLVRRLRRLMSGEDNEAFDKKVQLPLIGVFHTARSRYSSSR